MMTLRHLRTLPCSAASGLVVMGNRFYVIADDALHLGVFKLDDPGFAQQLRLRKGTLPAAAGARKKQKPDFEALAHLPARASLPHGALLAIGSGSKANRQQAVCVPLNAGGDVETTVATLDFAPLYAALALIDCNIEGAVVCGEQLILLQRGNQRHETSALVSVPLAAVGAPVSESNSTIAPAASIIPVALPSQEGVPFGFTDGIRLPNGNILFSAVAEATDDSYNDGAFLGAVIGEVTLQGDVLRCEYVSGSHKIEGIALAGDQRHVYAVTDADDPAVPASLFVIPLEH